MYKPAFLVGTVLIIASVISMTNTASAASFNCNKAKGCVENVICQSPQLSNLDSEMASLYFTLKDQSSRRGAKALLRSQRSWLRKRNRCKCDANCLVSNYRARIKLFEDVLGY